MKGYQSNRQLSEMILPLGSQPKEVRVYLREKGIMAQRIFVIDDTQELLDFLRAILEKQGYEVYIAKNVFEDLHEVEHLHPDLIILDFMMGSKRKDGTCCKD